MASKSKQIAAYKTLLKTDNFAAALACLALYARQTADEQQSGATKHDNNVGFSAYDAEWGGKMARALQERGFTKASTRVPLSKRERGIVGRIVPKYAKQLFEAGLIFGTLDVQEPEQEMDGNEYRDEEERMAVAGAYATKFFPF